MSTTTPAELVDKFASLLTHEVDKEAWAGSMQGLEEQVNALCQQIYARSEPSADGSKDSKLWGYHFLRWILFAGKPGPALVPSMMLLGRDEVLTRVRNAAEAAKQQL